MNASFAAGAALALACDRTDLTRPDPLPAPSTSPQPGPTDSIIFQDGFENGIDSTVWWVENPLFPRYSVTTTPARVKSGTRSLQVLFDTTDRAGGLHHWFMPGVDDVYVKFHVMFEENFQNKRTRDGGGLHFFVLCGNHFNDDHSCFGKAGQRPDGSQWFYAGLDPEEDSLPKLMPFSFYTYWPGMSCGSPCFGESIVQTLPKTPLVGGQWQEVVFNIKMNTVGQSNGSQTVWLNGVKKLEKLNMLWRTTTALKLNHIRLDNYMPTGLKTQHLWVDDITVWAP